MSTSGNCNLQMLLNRRLLDQFGRHLLRLRRCRGKGETFCVLLPFSNPHFLVGGSFWVVRNFLLEADSRAMKKRFSWIQCSRQFVVGFPRSLGLLGKRNLP